MLLIRILIVAILLMPFASIQARASKSLITVQLQQAVDSNCDGVRDSVFSSNYQLNILPQQCVIYKITAQNTSQQVLTKVALKGNIPDYTHFKPNSISVYENGKVRQTIVYQRTNLSQVKAEIEKFAPLKTIIMTYSVVLD